MTDERQDGLISRRRAIQLGAATAWTVPTIQAIAQRPAYAGTSSTGTIDVIDDFSVDQADGVVGASSVGSSVFPLRDTVGASVTNGQLSLLQGGGLVAGMVIRWYGSTIDLSGCTHLELRGLTLVDGGGGPTVPGALTLYVHSATAGPALHPPSTPSPSFRGKVFELPYLPRSNYADTVMLELFVDSPSLGVVYSGPLAAG